MRFLRKHQSLMVLAVAAVMGMAGCAPKPTDALSPAPAEEATASSDWQSHEVQDLNVNVRSCLDQDQDGNLSDWEQEDLMNKIKRCEQHIAAEQR